MTITAATPNEFVNFVVMVRRPVLLASALMIALTGAMAATFAGVAFLTEPGFAILLLGIAFMATGIAASARVAGKELPRIDWMVEAGTAVAAAAAIGVATVIVTGHPRDAGLACAATLAVIFVLFAIQFANGGIPGRVGLMLRLGRWLPLYGAGPVNDIVAQRLREAATDLPRGSAEALPAGPDPRDERLASQLEHLMQRRLGLTTIGWPQSLAS